MESMLQTITRKFPPIPIAELLEGINSFDCLELSQQREFISLLVSKHPILTVQWGPGWRYRRARKIGENEYPKNVQDLLWRPNLLPLAGRANPEGFSVLYLGDRPETALNEIRVEHSTVLMSELEIRPEKQITVCPIGEFMQIQRTGRGFLCGEASKSISSMINACSHEEAKSLLITDAFLYECLVSDDEEYKKSSWVAKSIFEKNLDCSAIAYSSVRLRGALNFAVRTENFWDAWGISSARRMQAKHLTLGYYELSNICHVTGIWASGKLEWDSKIENTNSVVLLAPLWTP
ncbi:RES domain-containing protein [Methylomonas sp. HW2-6]|uniref:RES domain-containing protein n=1 Tax=Methylomonas sp. HW2-6 TaxID=3376687 RepID=UPI0040419825